MAYTKTSWVEHDMDTAAKLAALDNLEDMYTEAVAYIDANTHSSRYYTDAEMNAKFYHAGNDGTGSGCTCESVDGYTASEMMNLLVPKYTILPWTGARVDIPYGWGLCDGSTYSGVVTPNLQGKFIACAGQNYSINQTNFGTENVTSTGTVTIGDHTLTAAELPKHTHTIPDERMDSDPLREISGSGRPKHGRTEATHTTDSTGGDDPHSHTATYTGTSDQSKLPKYMALDFIMKVI